MHRRSGEAERNVITNSDEPYGAERLLERDGIGRATNSGRKKSFWDTFLEMSDMSGSKSME